jgi:hypothetical protein
MIGGLSLAVFRQIAGSVSETLGRRRLIRSVRIFIYMNKKCSGGCKLAAGAGVYLSDGSQYNIGSDDHGYGR